MIIRPLQRAVRAVERVRVEKAQRRRKAPQIGNTTQVVFVCYTYVGIVLKFTL